MRDLIDSFVKLPSHFVSSEDQIDRNSLVQGELSVKWTLQSLY